MMPSAVLLAENSSGGAPQGIMMFIPSWSEIIISVICLAIILWIVVHFASPTFLKMLDTREEKIEGGLKRAEAAQEQADQAKAKRAHELEDALAEAGRIREQARAEGQTIIDEARAKAHAEADRIIEAAQHQLTQEKQATEVALRADLGDLAVRLAEKIVGEALTDQALAGRVVDRFLDELAAESTPAVSAAAVSAAQED